MLDLDLKNQYHRSDPSLTTKYKLKYILVETWSLVIPRRFKQTELHVSTSMWRSSYVILVLKFMSHYHEMEHKYDCLYDRIKIH